MKLRDLLIVVPLALVLVSCGHSSSDPASGASGSSAIAGGSTTAPAQVTPSSGPSSITVVGPSGSSGGTVSSFGCAQYPTHPLYNYSLSGLGNVSATTPSSSAITADSHLAVSIEPGNAGQTAGTGGTANYSSLSATVHLLRDGIEVASQTINGQSIKSPSNVNFLTGVPINQISSKVDFSSYLSGNGTYTIRVDNIRTDYKCNTYCTTTYYQCLGYYPQVPTCGYNVWRGDLGQYVYYDWNWDIHQYNPAAPANAWACCPTTMLNDCQKQQCGVGTILDNSSWSLNVLVETDSTPCIGQ